MQIDDHRGCAAVTYRATSVSGADLEMRLVIPPDGATLFDAWSRLTAIHGEVSPTSVEVEIRHREAERTWLHRTTVLDLALAVLRSSPNPDLRRQLT